MLLRDRLTNEQLLKQVGKAPFELVNYAIGLGQEHILAGRGFYTESPIHNQAFQILLEIDSGKDKLPPPTKRAPVQEAIIETPTA
jgi:hypothetical protein